ncbi:hypothetical protein GQ457_14G025140 [Hibiscus cannabinus]
MATVTHRLVETEEPLHELGNTEGTNDVTDEHGRTRCMVEFNAGVVAGDVNVTIFVGVKTAGQGREERQRLGEGLLEERNE